MKWALRLMGGAGVFAFGLALALTFLAPIHVERAARGFIQSQLEAYVTERLAAFQDDGRAARINRLAGALAERHNEEITALRERLATGLNAQVVATIDRMQDLSCECRQRMLRALDTATALRISSLERAEPQLRRLIEGKYSEIVADLLRDLRIFTAANLVAFLLLLVLSFAKPGHLRPLFVPGVLLGVAAVTTSAIYLLGQNWFFTLLYSDFVGLAYAGWLALIYGLFLDIAMFEARVTRWIVDAVASAVGNAPVPC